MTAIQEVVVPDDGSYIDHGLEQAQHYADGPSRQFIPWGLQPEAARAAPEADRRAIARHAVRGVRIAGIETNFGFIMQAEQPQFDN